MGFKNSDRCLAKVDDDEPIFVLRAQDESAPERILDWIGINRRSLTEEHLREAFQCVDQFREWQLAHPERVKSPD